MYSIFMMIQRLLWFVFLRVISLSNESVLCLNPYSKDSWHIPLLASREMKLLSPTSYSIGFSWAGGGRGVCFKCKKRDMHV